MQTIVVGYDGSESADRALDRTTELIENGGSVVLVSAIHMLAGKGSMGYDPVEKENVDQQLDVARDRLAEAGIAATTVEGIGDPARVIAAEAKQTNAELIVVGNSHKNMLERLLFGSVSGSVAHRAECAVLVVP